MTCWIEPLGPSAHAAGDEVRLVAVLAAAVAAVTPSASASAAGTASVLGKFLPTIRVTSACAGIRRGRGLAARRIDYGGQAASAAIPGGKPNTGERRFVELKTAKG